jgi:DNA-binding SARP family transcriptional activator
MTSGWAGRSWPSLTVGEEVAAGVLGPLRVTVDGRSFGSWDFGGRKPKQIVEILLVHQGEPVAKDRIADLLWGEALPRDPVATLEAYVSGLRARLHPDGRRARAVLRSEPAAYRFALDGASFDLWEFDELGARAARAPAGEAADLRQQALAFVRGDVVADEPYADWALPLRELYRERHIEMVLDAARDLLLAGDAAAALQLAEHVGADHPTRERAYRLIMTARYALGDQDLALQTYDRCRRAMIEHLGVDPLPDTERIYLGVLDQEPLDHLLGAPPPRAAATANGPRRRGSPVTSSSSRSRSRPRTRRHGSGSAGTCGSR